MALGMEMAIRSLMGAMGVDVEAVKEEAVRRIADFESNVATLNANIASLNANVKALCEASGVTYTPPAIVIPADKQAAE